MRDSAVSSCRPAGDGEERAEAPGEASSLRRSLSAIFCFRSPQPVGTKKPWSSAAMTRRRGPTGPRRPRAVPGRGARAPWGRGEPSRAGEAASLRRSLSATFFFRAGACGERRRRRGGPSELRRSAAQSVDGHRDGGFAEAQREAIGDRRRARSTVVGQPGQAGLRSLGRQLGTSVGAETPGPHPVAAASQGGRSWVGRSSCSPAQRGCPRGVRRGERRGALA